MRSERIMALLGALDRHRIYVLLALVFATMPFVATGFCTGNNLTTVLKSSCLNATVAIGFTIVMICGELDLSIGATLTIGAMLAIGLRTPLGLPGCLAAAIAAGALVGLVNGLIVTKARVNSFIATLGSMTILQGLIYIYCHGSSMSITGAADLNLADFLEEPLVPLLTPRVLITVVLVALAQVYLTWTRPGRNVFLVGGNRETAWFAGVNPVRYVIGAFVASGVFAAVGGALFSLSICAATPNLGTSCLMDVIAATIVGGTAMAGGRGSVLRSALAVLTFTALFNGFNLLGFQNELKVLLAGVVLALVVVYEAVVVQRHERSRGQRPDLLAELVENKRRKG
jgi:ribose transport system permease protein